MKLQEVVLDDHIAGKDNDIAPRLEVKDRKNELIEELGLEKLLLKSDDAPAICKL